TSARLAEKGKDNIWMVEKVAGEWVDPVLINNLSTNRNESLGSFSEDESVGYLFANYLSDSKMGDIYMSRKHDKGWEKPGLVSGVNTEKIELQPSVFEDRIMFFASNRDGGFGELDLYVSEKVGGSWSKPENLGPVINTQEFEETPFLEWDGKTLYFASNGHPGLGGFDIFKSEKIGETWQDWSKPENLGLVINSVKDERYFYRSPLSNIAYISSNRFIGLGHEDIYCVNITPPEIIEEEPPPPALVEPEEDIVLEDLQVDEVIVIDNIYFEFDKAILLEKSFPTLDYLVKELLKNPQLTVEISGHTDDIGSNEYNLNLSLERAVSVIDYLIEKGVPADNLISKGYGEEDPIADNSTDEGRSQNRRVEMKIVDIEEEVIEPEVEVEEIEIEVEE
ncbi:MAG: OmpA family protein, partial [Candidatus Cloacimonetes bacterium]|nr:OmpA family protein [Candidatus Cloacimonadota bacterium]